MVNFAMSFATKLSSKLLLLVIFLCLGVPGASAKQPYADVFALIQKIQSMHPLTIKKLLDEGFVIIFQEIGRYFTTLGTGPKLADGT